MDPFSIIVGTAGLIDICTRFAVYLRDVHAGAAHIEDEISALSQQLKSLKSVNETIKASYEAAQVSYSHKVDVPQQAAKLWHNIHSSLQDCRRVVEDLEQLVKYIIGKEKSDSGSRLTSKFESFRKQLRKLSSEGDFDKLYSRLNTFQNTLQLMLDLVILWVLIAMCQHTTLTYLGPILASLTQLQQNLSMNSSALQGSLYMRLKSHYHPSNLLWACRMRKV